MNGNRGGNEMLDCVGGEVMWVHRNGSSSTGVVIVASPEVICPWQLVVSGNGDPSEGRSGWMTNGGETLGNPGEAERAWIVWRLSPVGQFQRGVWLGD